MIKTEKQLIKEFKVKGKVTSGGGLYLPLKHGYNLLNRSREYNFAVIGVEGFLVHQDTGAMEAKLDWIADYSNVFANTWNEYVTICYSKAKKFLEELPKSKNIWVNFVFLEEANWN